MTMLTVTPGARHWTSNDVYGELGERHSIPTGSRIPDGMALAIASWWQAPAGTGRVLAALASGLPVDQDALLDDIEATQRERADSMEPGGPDHEDALALDALHHWAEEYVPPATPEQLAAVGPDPWFDPDAASAHQPPPF